MGSAVRITIAVASIGVLTACSSAVAPTVDPAGIQATVDAVLTANAPAPTVAPPDATAVPGPSFEAVAYTDSVAGFEFDHPAGWTVGPVEQQSRGGITAFTSWARPTDVFPNETPQGETRLDATVQLWDPGDLEAFLDQRFLAWDASGITIVSQEEWTLEDGRAAASFVVEGVDGAQGFFFFTTIGEKYLVLSGEGDLALLGEIAHTVRPKPLDEY